LRRFAKEIKRNIKAKKFGLHGSQLREIKEKALVVAEVPNLGPVWDCSAPPFVALLLNFPAKQVQLHKLCSQKKMEF